MTFWGELLGIAILFSVLFVSGAIALAIDRGRKRKKERLELHRRRHQDMIIRNGGRVF